MNKKALNLLGMAFLICTSYAQEKTQDSITVEQLETVVLDTKFKLDRERSGKVIYKITQEDLAKVKGQSLAQTINTVSGIEIVGSKSNQGSILKYKIRGGKNAQVVILIDGIQVNDPSSIASDFDLRLLDVNTIESIDIIKGGVSTLYGTGATTGVINITTKKASDKNATGTVFMSSGSNRSVATDKYKLNTANAGINVNGTLKKFNYLAAFSTEYAKGISGAKSADENVKFEDDPFKRENARVTLGYDFTEKFKLGTFAALNKTTYQYDSGALIDGTNEATTKNIQLGLSSEYKFKKGAVILNTSFAKTNTERISTSTSESKSNSVVADLYTKYKFTKKIWAVLGVNFQAIKMNKTAGPWETGISKEDTDETIVDPYLNLTYLTDFGLTVNGGVRLSNHSIYGNHLVYNINPSYSFDATDKLDVKVLASGSSAFIAPSLYQKYSPNYGNEDLDPQESINGEAGFELNYNKKHRLSAVAFHREDKNVIDWAFTGYFNVDDNKVKTQGIELETKLNLVKNLDVNVNYTFSEFETSELSFNVAKHKANVSLGYTFKEKTGLSLAYQYMDKRYVGIWNNSTYEVDPTIIGAYNLVNFFVNHQLTSNLEVNGSLFNIFDEDFTEAYGYSTRGRNYKLGLVLTF
ncbi:MAG: TonB-dependent receptor [Kordia sp.]|nr:MAG: TonB-dependent receptor [Kordia sp.]